MSCFRMWKKKNSYTLDHPYYEGDTSKYRKKPTLQSFSSLGYEDAGTVARDDSQENKENTESNPQFVLNNGNLEAASKSTVDEVVIQKVDVVEERQERGEKKEEEAEEEEGRVIAMHQDTVLVPIVSGTTFGQVKTETSKDDNLDEDRDNKAEAEKEHSDVDEEAVEHKEMDLQTETWDSRLNAEVREERGVTVEVTEVKPDLIEVSHEVKEVNHDIDDIITASDDVIVMSEEVDDDTRAELEYTPPETPELEEMVEVSEMRETVYDEATGQHITTITVEETKTDPITGEQLTTTTVSVIKVSDEELNKDNYDIGDYEHIVETEVMQHPRSPGRLRSWEQDDNVNNERNEYHSTAVVGMGNSMEMDLPQDVHSAAHYEYSSSSSGPTTVHINTPVDVEEHSSYSYHNY